MPKLMRKMTEMATGASPNAGMLIQQCKPFVVATIAAIFMTFSGAIGTGIVPFWTRLLYWVIVMETGAIIGIGVATGIQSWGGLQRHPIVEMLAISTLIALPTTLAVIGAGMTLLHMSRPDIDKAIWMFLLVLLVSAIITVINQLIGSKKQAMIALAAAQTQASPASMFDNRFRTRLPLHLQGSSLLALVSEDHYLRAYTDNGSALILMRLSDAIAELGSETGAQTHRSWWVARDAVAKAVRADGKAVLTLVDGTEVPVSRTYYRILRTQGWFS